LGRVARRRRPILGCVSPSMSLAPGFDLEGSHTVASSTPIRISVPSTDAPGHSVCRLPNRLEDKGHEDADHSVRHREPSLQRCVVSHRPCWRRFRERSAARPSAGVRAFVQRAPSQPLWLGKPPIQGLHRNFAVSSSRCQEIGRFNERWAAQNDTPGSDPWPPAPRPARPRTQARHYL
jgi:hypothetical protein